jgi:hypothetical protein
LRLLRVEVPLVWHWWLVLSRDVFKRAGEVFLLLAHVDPPFPAEVVSTVPRSVSLAKWRLRRDGLCGGDGVELIVESAASARAPKVEEAGDHDHPEYRARCQRIFGAVLEEDATHLQYAT